MLQRHAHQRVSRLSMADRCVACCNRQHNPLQSHGPGGTRRWARCTKLGHKRLIDRQRQAFGFLSLPEYGRPTTRRRDGNQNECKLLVHAEALWNN